MRPRCGYSAKDWRQAKQEVKTVLIGQAKARAVISYFEVAARVTASYGRLVWKKTRLGEACCPRLSSTDPAKGSQTWSSWSWRLCLAKTLPIFGGAGSRNWRGFSVIGRGAEACKKLVGVNPNNHKLQAINSGASGASNGSARPFWRPKIYKVDCDKVRIW